MTVDTKKILRKTAKNAVPLKPVTAAVFSAAALTPFEKGLAEFQGFSAAPGKSLVVPDTATGLPETVYTGIGDADDFWAFAPVAGALPYGDYRIDDSQAPLSEDQAYKAGVAWALSQYKARASKGAIDSSIRTAPALVVPQAARHRMDEMTSEIAATWQVRDLINAPASALNTEELSAAVRGLAAEFNVKAEVIKGRKLEKEFPLIHAVGKASDNQPNLTFFSWSGSDAGDTAPMVMLVGKGVTFDTGGVQVKTGDGMKSMKKDMGGAATVLGLARMIMANDLPVRLAVLTPIAENSVSGGAFRPGDIITARNGREVEIGHTDAEGRLILADAITFGIETFKPDIIMDFATLTGAQRVADGTEVGGLFCTDRAIGRQLEDIGMQWGDPLQYHHLFDNYRPLLRGNVSGTLDSSPGGPGAITAALFLQEFTKAAGPHVPWMHFDVNGMNNTSRPGRPKGGEAMGMRAAYRWLETTLKP